MTHENANLFGEVDPSLSTLAVCWRSRYSILSIREQLDTHHLNLDGSHAPAKKGGEAVAYQGRKKAKTSNVLPITDASGFILATTGVVAGNHNDAFELKDNLRTAFKFIKRLWHCHCWQLLQCRCRV